jgi:Trypsin-co-occurring domain 1
MNGAESTTRVVTAVLPSGMPIKIEVAGPDSGEVAGPDSGEVAGPDSGDGMASVGLRDLDLGDALDTVGEICSVVVEKLKAAKPSRATVELRLGFAVAAGKLTALWVGGKGEAALTVTLEWSEHHHPAKASSGNG